MLGKMPEAENEIIVEQSYLEHLGLPVQLDQTVTLDMPFGKNQTYHVCGIIQSSNASRIYQVIVSDGLYSRYEKSKLLRSFGSREKYRKYGQRNFETADKRNCGTKRCT